MSVTDNKGNQSTSLMGRELLTPDEVKQLHYKTIIFPVVGYPIFRDTVLYSKFSCYEAGEVNREVTSLKDLSNTYFTVEQLDFEISDDEEEFDDLNNEFLKEAIKQDEEKLYKAIAKIKNILKNEIYKYSFKEKNNRT